MSKFKPNEYLDRCAHETGEFARRKRSIYFDIWSIQEEIKEGTVQATTGEDDNAFKRECDRCSQKSLIEDNNLCNVCVDDLGGL